MLIEENIQLIRTLLDQLSADTEIDSVNLIGDQGEILFGLREMVRLGLISGTPHYSVHSDPAGPLFSSVSAIILTKRGILFK